jgi:hypothetical protein
VSRILLVALAVVLLATTAALADPPAGARQITGYQRDPSGPGGTVVRHLPAQVSGPNMGTSLDSITAHNAPVTYAEYQLLRDGWTCTSSKDRAIGERKIYQIPSQDHNYWGPFYGAGMFATRDVYVRRVDYRRSSTREAPGPDLEKVKPSWQVNYRADDDEKVELVYYWANVPVLIEIHEVESTVTRTTVETTTERIGVVDP